MKKIYLFFIALCVLGFTEVIHAKRKSSLRHLKKIRVGKSKTVRGFDKIIEDPESKGDVHIIKIGDEKHEITGMEDGIVILNFYDKDGNKEEKVIDIRDRAPEIQSNINFGFGFRPYGYYRSDPFYDPFWGWGRSWNRPHYNYYW
jgi:hypothetical protein